MPKSWILTPPSPDCASLAERLRLPQVVAQLLINRGLKSDRRIGEFLSPSLSDLLPPARLAGAEDAASIVVNAIASRQKIVLYGDYDVDGTTGVAILWHVLRQAGAEVTFYVPHRIEEGYGLNSAAVKRLVEEGAQLIISVDCGITAIDIAEELKRSRVPLIITDHHSVADRLPAAAAIVHPAIGEGSGNPHLCGAGVAFKLAWAVAQRISGAERVLPEYRDLLRQLLPLAALGTIADVVPLNEENRIIARHGLSSLPHSTIPGIRALIEFAGLDGSKIDGVDVGFKLAPRINAAGRMGHARLAVELLTRADAERAREIALYLEGHNRARQSAERKILAEACEIIEANGLAGDARRAIVLAHKDWHAGVIGIVAARIVERYHRPAVLIALSEGEGQGSARGVTHFDLTAALTECRRHLSAFGGHAMAAGLRIAAENVEPFTESFVDFANNRLTGEDLKPKLRVDAEVTLDALSVPIAEAILGLGPFGVGNPKPRLATDWVDLSAEPRCVGAAGQHLQAVFAQHGARVKGIGFGLASHAEDLKQHRKCRVAFEPLVNNFNGRRTVEMRILDLKFPSPTGP